MVNVQSLRSAELFLGYITWINFCPTALKSLIWDPKTKQRQSKKWWSIILDIILRAAFIMLVTLWRRQWLNLLKSYRHWPMSLNSLRGNIGRLTCLAQLTTSSLTMVSLTGSSSVERSLSAFCEPIGTDMSPSTRMSSDIEMSDKPANCDKKNGRFKQLWHIRTSMTFYIYINWRHTQQMASSRLPMPGV